MKCDRLQQRQAEMRERINGKPSAVADLTLERHFRPAEIAELWAMSHSAVIALFADESGVLVLDRPEERNKRTYRTLSKNLTAALWTQRWTKFALDRLGNHETQNLSRPFAKLGLRRSPPVFPFMPGNCKAKGTRNEHKSIALLEAKGLDVREL